jgi:hypothetical protein
LQSPHVQPHPDLERQLALLSQHRCRHTVEFYAASKADTIRAKKADVEALISETDAVRRTRTEATNEVKRITAELAEDNVSPNIREGR